MVCLLSFLPANIKPTLHLTKEKKVLLWNIVFYDKGYKGWYACALTLGKKRRVFTKVLL